MKKTKAMRDNQCPSKKRQTEKAVKKGNENKYCRRHALKEEIRRMRQISRLTRIERKRRLQSNLNRKNR